MEATKEEKVKYFVALVTPICLFNFFIGCTATPAPDREDVVVTVTVVDKPKPSEINPAADQQNADQHRPGDDLVEKQHAEGGSYDRYQVGS